MKDKNYLPFDLEEAKAGRPVITRTGYSVHIITFETKAPIYPIVAIITHKDGRESVKTFTREGRFRCYCESDEDLVMAPLEYSNTFWINLYLGRDSRVVVGNGIFISEHEAKEESHLKPFGLTYLATVAVKVEWHEGEPQPRTAAGHK